MHHDSFWQDPWRFDPTRFLDEKGQLLPSSHEKRRRYVMLCHEYNKYGIEMQGLGYHTLRMTVDVKVYLFLQNYFKINIFFLKCVVLR